MGTLVAAPSARLVSGCGARLFGARRAAGACRRGAAQALPIGNAKGGYPCDPVGRWRGLASSVSRPLRPEPGRLVTPGVGGVRVRLRAAGGSGPSLLPGRGACARGAGEGRQGRWHPSDLTPCTPALYAPATRLVPPPPA